MAEEINGPFVFTVLDENNNSYFVRGDNPLALYHFKKGFYVYASMDMILESALVELGLSDLAFEKIENECGDVLKIDSYGRITRAAFQPYIYPNYSYEWQGYFIPINSYVSRFDIPEEYIDLMLDYGYTLGDIEDLCGIPETIEMTVSEILCEYGYCNE